MPPDTAKAVIHKREVYSSLMELSRTRILELQEKAVLTNYLEGTGRKLDSVPHSYTVPDGKGGTYEKETYFKYLHR